MNGEMSFEKKDEYLLITGEGERNDLSEVIEGTKLVYEAIEWHNCQLVLIDYRKINFNVRLTEAFNIIKVYEAQMPNFKNIAMAAVVNNESREIADFWKTIGKRRNFNFEIFESVELAEKWLLSTRKKV